MLNLGGISAWVEVDGQELEQYGVAEDLEKNEVTCWIATQVGKNFSVVYRDNAQHREHSLSSCLRLDGTDVPGRVLRPATVMSHSANFEKKFRTVIQKDHVVSATSVRPFIFSKLELTDEDEYFGQASKHLGDIQLVIDSVEISQPGMLATNSDVFDQGKVHERSKKAVSHCVSCVNCLFGWQYLKKLPFRYGQEMKTTPNYVVSVRHLHAAPLATFTFKYRDYSLLQASGIIPKPPAAKEQHAAFEEVLDLTIDDDIKQGPASDEIMVLDNAIRAMREQRAVLLSKRSNMGASGPLVKRTKREEKFIPTGEVIDLT
ncbi:hypothetical protein BS17DRAFT_781217 [Gyrodon lividus]|nr:hypothetical protein BS17DRAFT_781217 [Gyrodon lividus]